MDISSCSKSVIWICFFLRKALSGRLWENLAFTLKVNGEHV